MENTILMYNNSLNFSLKQTVNNINDLIFNIQSLKQLQINIDEIQSLKEEAQLKNKNSVLMLLTEKPIHIAIASHRVQRLQVSVCRLGIQTSQVFAFGLRWEMKPLSHLSK